MLREGKSWSGREQNCVYLNTRDGRFADISGISGLDLADDGRAAALVDWDLDGRQDIWLAGRNSPRLRLMLNRSRASGSSVTVQLQATKGARDAIGARVAIHIDQDAPLVDSVRAGEGYLAQSSRWLHFGLGTRQEPVKAVVVWPGLAGEQPSSAETFEGLEPGGRYVLVQGSGLARSVQVETLQLDTGAFASHQPSERGRIALTLRPPLPPTIAEATSGEEFDLSVGSGKPRWINVWASWCAPCLGELREFVDRRADLEASGLSLLALCADEPAARPQARTLLEDMGWTFSSAFATPQTLDTLDALQRTLIDRRRRMPLPISFLVDSAGEVAVIYKGPVTVDALLEDVAQLASADESRQRSSSNLPFTGRWITAPDMRPPLSALHDAYQERGLELAANDAARRQIDVRQSSPADLLVQMGMQLAGHGRLQEAAEHFARALSHEPDHHQAHLNLAIARHHQGDVEPAIDGYKRVLRADPRNSMALYNLALARCTMGDMAAAHSDLEALVQIDPAAAERLRLQIETHFQR